VEPQGTAALLAAAESLLGAVTLGSMRVFGLTFVFPLFSWTRLTGVLRMVFALGVSLPVSLAARHTLAVPDWPMLLVLAAKEFAVGAFLGLLLAVPFWGLQAAGDVVDAYRGASAANLQDPMNAAEQTVLGALLVQLGLALFVVSGGLLALLGVVHESYAAWPLARLAPPFDLALGRLVGAVLGALVRVAITVAFPLLMVLLLVDLALVFLARSARQFPAFDLSVTLKNLAFLLMLPACAAFLATWFRGEWEAAVAVLRIVLRGS
jgi:type III secretion protein SpaR/YscT/HrcT